MNIVSFFAPRPDHPYFQDYTPFLDILRASCEWLGCQHMVLTDDPGLPGGFLVPDLPHNLMRACLKAQLAYLKSDAAREDTILVGADCVLGQNPAEVFKQEFDIAFTTGPFSDCILNTGAIYIRGGANVAHIWNEALATMSVDAVWGDDQKALAGVVHPTLVPSVSISGNGPVIRFLPVDPYNLAPEYPDDDCTRGYVLHFRGPRKAWMKDYCAKWLGIGERPEWNVVGNTPKEKIFENVAINSRRKLPWVNEEPAHEKHAVLIGGGPSAADDLAEIRLRHQCEQPVFALNGAASWLMEHGIWPDYQVILDARPENRRFLRPICASRFLIASQCDPSLLDILAGEDVTLFHHAEEGIDEHLPPERCPTTLIGAGVTVGLTAMALVYALGYRYMHLYGYDSSDRAGEGHVYPQDEAGKPEADRREVWVGRKSFICGPAMFAQAQEFPRFARLLAENDAMITVHGSGLLPEIAKQSFGPFWASRAA